jgi:hypothetical protein
MEGSRYITWNCYFILILIRKRTAQMVCYRFTVPLNHVIAREYDKVPFLITSLPLVCNVFGVEMNVYHKHVCVCVCVCVVGKATLKPGLFLCSANFILSRCQEII